MTSRTLDYGNYGIVLIMGVMQDLYHQPYLPGLSSQRLNLHGQVVQDLVPGACFALSGGFTMAWGFPLWLWAGAGHLMGLGP